MNNRVLIIDDEINICESIQLILDYEGYAVEFVTSGEEGLAKVAVQEQYEVILVDIQLPGMNGFEVVKIIKEKSPATNIIIISAYGNIENAVKATKLGAFDFLEKPVDREKLLIAVRNACSQASLLRENEEMKKALGQEGNIIGKSLAIKRILELITTVAPTDARILITGENGTGKELVARAIHNQSLRKDAAFIDVNCAAIPTELIESELFGHEKGSFTGAFQQRIGKFELADKGTLFLDEIGDMSLQAQAKVLRAIEDGKIERVGGTKKIPVDVRLISATNKNLAEEITKGNFREDLFHRINVIPLQVPSLRERLDDIALLVDYFARIIATKYNKKIPVFHPVAITLLQKQPWNGNIRELRNVIERIIIMTPKQEITDREVHTILPNEKVGIDDLILESNSFQDFKEKAEKAYIVKQLELNNWNVSKTAEVLDIQRSHLYNKIKKYGLMKENMDE
jgi:two-component system nitrogen regulation response regulator NtrX